MQFVSLGGLTISSLLTKAEWNMTLTFIIMQIFFSATDSFDGVRQKFLNRLKNCSNLVREEERWHFFSLHFVKWLFVLDDKWKKSENPKGNNSLRNGERGRERLRKCACVCVHVRKRKSVCGCKKERECVCAFKKKRVCVRVCVWERERKKEGWRERGRKM